MNNRHTTVLGILIAGLLFLYLLANYSWRQGALFCVGLSAGIILYHAAFGFTAAWREMVTTGRGSGLRAQMIMLAITVVIFTPLIAQGEVFGSSVRGSVAPLSIGVIFGAFMFGIGMQLGGGCASGTLFTAGGGNVRMLITLASFVAGSLIGTHHWSLWQQAPSLAPVSLAQNFGPLGAILISMALFTVVYHGSKRYESYRHRDSAASPSNADGYSWLRGPWPLIAGALGLAMVNVSTLILAGRPWGVTSAFALWGAKIAAPFGVDVGSWPYWQRPGQLAALENSVLLDITSVMNIGIVIGAFIAAGLASKFSPSVKIPPRSIVAAILGGLLLGYGARIAYGCNIGAYFGGISSTSLHGWLWFVAAVGGSILGTRLRPLFDLKN